MNKLFIVGDSINQFNGIETYPQTGIGQTYILFVKENVQIINLAVNGASTKSFLDKGYFERARKEMSKGDVLLIQFGHNDEKVDAERHTDPYSTYQTNLKYFIDDARKAGAYPILLTSLYRRHFVDGIIEENCHLDYPTAMIQLAQKEMVPCIDMCEISKQYLIKLGDIPSKRLYMNFEAGLYSNYPDGKKDDSHLRYDGAVTFAKLIIKEVIKQEIKPLLDLLK